MPPSKKTTAEETLRDEEASSDSDSGDSLCDFIEADDAPRSTHPRATAMTKKQIERVLGRRIADASLGAARFEVSIRLIEQEMAKSTPRA